MTDGQHKMSRLISAAVQVPVVHGDEIRVLHDEACDIRHPLAFHEGRVEENALVERKLCRLGGTTVSQLVTGVLGVTHTSFHNTILPNNVQ